MMGTEKLPDTVEVPTAFFLDLIVIEIREAAGDEPASIALANRLQEVANANRIAHQNVRIAEFEVIAREVISVHEDADHGADIPIYIYKLAKAAMEQK